MRTSPARRLKILHVTSVDGGGVVDAIRQYVRVAAGATHFVAATDQRVLEILRPGTRAALHLRGNPARATASLRAHIRTHGIDVVHAHSSWAGFTTRGLPLGVPVIYQPHSFYFDNPDLAGHQRLAYRLAERALSWRTTAFAVLTEHEDALAAGLNSRPIRARLHNVSKFSGATAPPRSNPAGALTVVTAGRIVTQKDPAFFAAISAARQEDRARFVWIGDGDPAECRLLERSGVHVTGWVDDSALHEVLSGASVYVHTARYEGFPLAILDAAELGLPILVREAAYVRDSELTTFSSVDQANHLLDRLRDEPHWWRAQTDVAARLVSAHSKERLAADLAALYSRTAGVR
jgi:glycosyltransferase involved in cell wall biosynthesis